MHSDQKQPEFKISDLDFLGCGSFNVSFNYTDPNDNKRWVIKVRMADDVTDTPERSIFLWNLFHPKNKAKLCKVNDKQAWMCPFVEKDEKGHLINYCQKDNKYAELIIDFYKKTQRIVLDIVVPGNIIGDKLVDVGYAVFAPSRKGRERRGSVASAKVANDCVILEGEKNRVYGDGYNKTINAFAAIAQQLADIPENRAFKNTFSTVLSDKVDNKLLDKYKEQLKEISLDSKASVFKYTENSLSEKILTFIKYLLLLTLVGLLIYDLCVSNLVISYLIKHYAVSFTPALIINSIIIALLLFFVINPLFSFIKQKISIPLSEKIFGKKDIFSPNDESKFSLQKLQNLMYDCNHPDRNNKALVRKNILSVNKDVLKIDSNGDDAVPIIYFAGEDQTAENAYNACEIILHDNSDLNNEYDLYFQNMPGVVDDTQLKIINDINAKYDLVLKIASKYKYKNKNICLYGYSLGGTVALAVAEKLKHSNPNIYKRLKIVAIDSPISTSSVVKEVIKDEVIKYKGSKKFKIKTLFCLIFASLLFLAYFLSPIYALYVSNIVACIICIVTTVTIDYFYDLFVNFFIRPLMSVSGFDVSVKSITKELFRNKKLFCVFANRGKGEENSIYNAISEFKNNKCNMLDLNDGFMIAKKRYVNERYPFYNKEVLSLLMKK